MRFSPSSVAEPVLELPLDEVRQPLPEEVQRFADALLIGKSHRSSLGVFRLIWRLQQPFPRRLNYHVRGNFRWQRIHVGYQQSLPRPRMLLRRVRQRPKLAVEHPGLADLGADLDEFLPTGQRTGQEVPLESLRQPP